MEDQRSQIDEAVSHVKSASKSGDVQVAEGIPSRFKDKANTPSGVVVEYLLKHVPEFKKLSELR